MQTVRAHLKRCADRLYVQELGGGLDRITILQPRKNWQTEYYNLMKSVTSELNAAYAEYEAGNSSGLPYEMYERFVELLQGCRAWMKEPGVVLITEEEYARLVHPETTTASTPQGVPLAVGLCFNDRTVASRAGECARKTLVLSISD